MISLPLDRLTRRLSHLNFDVKSSSFFYYCYRILNVYMWILRFPPSTAAINPFRALTSQREAKRIFCFQYWVCLHKKYKNKRKQLNWAPGAPRTPGININKLWKFNFWVFYVGPLFRYIRYFNTILRCWDLSRSIELGQIYTLVDLELNSADLMPIHGKNTKT